MSGYYGKLQDGLKILHNNIEKTVDTWYFISGDGCHNSDIIVIVFTDGTNTKKEGFTNIEYIIGKKCRLCVKVRDCAQSVFNKQETEVVNCYQPPQLMCNSFCKKCIKQNNCIKPETLFNILMPPICFEK